MSNYFKKIIFHIKLLKTGFVANEKWRQASGFELLHHKGVSHGRNKHFSAGSLNNWHREPNTWSVALIASIHRNYNGIISDHVVLIGQRYGTECVDWCPRPQLATRMSIGQPLR